MLDLHSLPSSWAVLAALLVCAAPACIASEDDDDEPNQSGTGGSTTGASGEAGAPASRAGASAGGSSEPGEAGGGAAGETGNPAGGADGEPGGASSIPGGGGLTNGGSGAGEPAEAGSGGAVEGSAGAPPTPSTGGTSSDPEKWGVVALSQMEQLYPAPINLLRASGAAATFPLTSGDGSCDVVELGACQLHTSCTSGSTQPSQGLNAGAVTITGFGDDLPLTFEATLGSYMSASIPAFLWTSSQSATVTVEGSADVPGFEMDLDLPNPIELTSPVSDADANYTISKGSDLTVAWTGGVEGFVTVSLGTEQDGVQIVCIVDAFEGEVSVPEAFLSQLGEAGSFTAGVTNVALETVEDWTMQFQAGTTKDVGTATFTE